MPASLNKVTLIGNLGADPEIRSTNDNREIASFSIATTESWKDKMTHEKREKTEWHRVVVFNEGLVRIIKSYVKKGSKLYLEGQLQTRKWTDNNNQDRYTTEVVMQNYGSSLVLLDSKGEANFAPGQAMSANHANNNNNQQKAQDQSKAFDNSELDDEIPF